jgi:hypothetical protein
MPREEYKNKRTKNVVRIIKRHDNLTHVVYVTSGVRAWFTHEDFNKLFKKI